MTQITAEYFARKDGAAPESKQPEIKPAEFNPTDDDANLEALKEGLFNIAASALTKGSKGFGVYSPEAKSNALQAVLAYNDIVRTQHLLRSGTKKKKAPKLG